MHSIQVKKHTMPRGEFERDGEPHGTSGDRSIEFFLGLGPKWSNDRCSAYRLIGVRFRRAILMVVFGLALTFQAGCSSFRLPRIDPTGQSIFLPWPESTTFDRRDAYPQSPRNPNPVGNALGVPGPLFPSAERTPKCPEDVIVPNPRNQPSDPKALAPMHPAVPRTMVPGCFQDRNGQVVNPDRFTKNQGRVSLSPRRVIAPVGSEVYVIGGICDEEGYYLTRSPVEWALQKGSVGTFAEPGRSGHSVYGRSGLLSRLHTEPLPELLSNDYALGCTSKRVQVLTAGTPDPSDDQFLLKGQTWIGVTSAQEGNSYVTMFAPELDAHGSRKATSVIHWIDGQWQLPTRITLTSGQPATLTTSLRRKLTTAPISSWLVRYEIVGGVPATFEDGSTVQEVYSDSRGRATVTVLPTEVVAGSTDIRVQIIRPTTGRGEPDRLLIGQGFTSVAWNTTNIALSITGPTEVALGDDADYRIEITNTGNVDAADVTIRSMIPNGMEFVTSNPPGRVQDSLAEWNVDVVSPNAPRIIDMKLRAVEGGLIRHCVTAGSDTVSQIEDCFNTRVTTEALYISMSGPKLPVEVGEIARFQVRIENRGTRRLTDVKIIDRFDQGLRQTNGEEFISEAITRDIDFLDPGESDEFPLNFIVDEPGKLCHRLEATATDSQPARVTACVIGEVAARPEIKVTLSGPQQMTVGQKSLFDVLLENTGDTVVSDVEVVLDFDNTLDPQFATPSTQELLGRITWTVPGPLEPGASQKLSVLCQAVAEIATTTPHVVATISQTGIEAADSMELAIFAREELEPFDARPSEDDRRNEVEPRDFDPGRNDRLGNDPPLDDDRFDDLGDRNNELEERPDAEEEFNDGRLDVTVEAVPKPADAADNLSGKREIDYFITITNDDDVDDREVQLRFYLDPKVKLVNYSGPTQDSQRTMQRTMLNLIPVKSLVRGSSISYKVTVSIEEPGEIIGRAEVTSMFHPDPIERINNLMVARE